MYQSSDRCAMLREEAIERPNCYMKYTWGDTINANSLGHLNQILYPYYKNDIETGVLFGDGPQSDEDVKRLSDILSAELEGLSVYG